MRKLDPGWFCFAAVMLVGALGYVAGWRRARFDGGERIFDTSLLVYIVAITAVAAPLVSLAHDGSCIVASLIVGPLCGFAGYFDRRRG